MWQRTGSTHLFPLLCAVVVSTTSSAFKTTLSNQYHTSQCDNVTAPKRFGTTTSASFDKKPLEVRRESAGELTPSSSSGQLPPEEAKKYARMEIPERGESSSHAIFGVLHGEAMIEKYEIWKRQSLEEENVVIGYATLGQRLDGHPGTVHGGILSLLFDETFGFAYEALGVHHAVTANLSVDYRAPVPAGTEVQIAVQLESREGRKLFWKAQMTSRNNETLYAEASSLFVIPRSS
jgi:acyl-coenzyme A thioesterase PaaI-like protein